MPRSVNPGTLVTGGGRAPRGTVEDNSLRNPNRDIDPLRVHVHDPSRAHMASAIGVSDAAGCFTSDNVEGALAEICSGASAGRLNGLVAGGRFDEVVSGLPTGGLTLTLEAGTEVLVGSGTLDLSGYTVTVPDGAISYVYLDADSTSPNYLTLQSSLTAPEVETSGGVENVLFGRVVSAGGQVTSYQDGRFFVRNLDRKVQYTSREGEDVDAWSEGCFATLDAFLLWVSVYGGTGEEKKGTVLIRGSHSLTSTLNVPVDNLQFVGDGNGVLLGGFAGNLVDVSGRKNITFRGLTFVYNGSLTSAVRGGSGTIGLKIEGCNFDGAFPVCVDIAAPLTGNANDIVVRECSSNDALKVVQFVGVSNALISGGVYVGPGAGTASSVGLEFQSVSPANANSDVKIQSVTLTGFETGVVSNRGKNVKVIGGEFSSLRKGFSFTTVDSALIAQSIITLDATLGENGVEFGGGLRPNVQGCTIINPRTVWNAEIPRGVSYTNAPVSLPVSSRFESNHIEGFLNTISGDGDGVFLGGADPVIDAVVQGNTFKGCSASFGPVENGVCVGNTFRGTANLSYLAKLGEGCRNSQISRNTFDGVGEVDNVIVIDGNAKPLYQVVVSGNLIEKAVQSGVLVYGDVQGYEVSLNSVDGFIDDANQCSVGVVVTGNSASGLVTENVIRRCQNGLTFLGTSSAPLVEATVSGNYVEQIGRDQNSQIQNYLGLGSKGVGFNWVERFRVTGNTVSEAGVIRNDSGTDVLSSSDVWPIGILALNSRNIEIDSNKVVLPLAKNAGYATGVWALSDDLVISEGVYVNNNTVQVEDQGAASPAHGIVFQVNSTPDMGGSTNRSYKEFGVVGNTLNFGLGGSTPASRGIWFTTRNTAGNPRGGSFVLGRVEGNGINKSSGAGIFFDLEEPSTPGINVLNQCSEISVRRNKVITANPLGAETLSPGISFVVQGSTDATPGSSYQAILNDLTVEGNRIPNAVGYGIRYSLQKLGPNDQITGSSINTLRNEVLKVTDNAGALAVTYGCAYEIQGASLTPLEGFAVGGNIITPEGDSTYPLRVSLNDNQISGLTVTDNTLGAEADLPGVTGPENCAVYVTGSVSVTKEANDLDFSNNRVTCYGNVGRGGFGFNLAKEYTLSGFSFSQNLIRVSQDTSVRIASGLDFSLGNASTGSGGTVEGFRVEGNVVTDGGVCNLNFNSNWEGVSVVGNTCNAGAVPVAGTAYSGIYLLGDGLSGARNFSNVEVSRNNLVGATRYGVFIELTHFGDSNGVQVSGNTLTGQESDGISVRSIGTSGSMASVTVEDNTLQGLGGKAVSMVVRDNMETVSISRNTISDCAGDPVIQITTPVLGSAGSAKNLRVDGNTVSNSGPGDYIFMDLARTTSASNLSLSRNYLSGAAIGSTLQNGLLLNLPSGVQSNYVRADGNRISAVNSRGIHVQLDALSGFSSCDNDISTATTGASEGIYLQGYVAGTLGLFEGIDISGNRLENNLLLGSFVGVHLEGAVTGGTDTFRGVSVDRNSFDKCASAVYLQGASFAIEGCSVSNNDYQGTGAVRDTLFRVSVSANTVSNLALRENRIKVDQVDGYAISFAATSPTSILGVSVCDNLVEYSDDASTEINGGVGVVVATGAGPIKGVDVSGNSISGVYGPGIVVGLSVPGATLCTGVSVTNNRVQADVSSDITEANISFACTGVGLYRGLSVLGNHSYSPASARVGMSFSTAALSTNEAWVVQGNNAIYGAGLVKNPVVTSWGSTPVNSIVTGNVNQQCSVVNDDWGGVNWALGVNANNLTF